MHTARAASEQSAANYRHAIRIAVTDWQKNGLSLRKSADRIGITEGALRELLRPAGQSRRFQQKKGKKIETEKA
jgi:hypothetical protein